MLYRLLTGKKITVAYCVFWVLGFTCMALAFVLMDYSFLKELAIALLFVTGNTFWDMASDEIM